MISPASALLATFLAVGAGALGATPSVNALRYSDDYVLRTWEVTEGLSDNHITSIARSADGYLWITNFSGLFRFDGSRFVLMDTESMPGLPTRWVAPVFAARNGALWLGLERGGVACWRGNEVTTLVPISPRPTSEVWPWSFAEESSGAVWVGITNGARALRISGGTVTAYSTAEGIPAGAHTMVRVGTDGKVWAATSSGCAVFDGRRFQPIDPEAGGGDHLLIALSRAGGMWTIRGGKLLREDSSGKRLETIAPEWLPGAGQINALLEDRDGALWIGTRDFGLLRFSDGAFSRVRTSFGDITCLEQDREGNLWVGTWGGGLNRLSPRHFFLRPTGLANDVVRSLGEDTEGRLWILDRNGEPARATEPGGHAFAPVPGWPAGQHAITLCADPAGGVWLGTPKGLAQWRDGELRETAFQEPVVALLAGRDDRQWLATDRDNIVRHRNGHWETVGHFPGAFLLAEDASGTLWVGTRHGEVFRRDGSRFAAVPLPGAGAEETVRFLVPDGKGTMWIGTLLGGLYRWKDGHVQRVPAPEGVSLAEVRSLLIERAKSPAQDIFWIGTATGLLRVSRADLEGFLDGRQAALRLVPCGSNEGLPNAEFTEGAQNTAQGRDGHLWFATNRGVLEIQPGAAPESPTEARVIVEEASAGPLTFRAGVSKSWIFPPLPGAIRIRYTLPDLRNPEEARFRYRLEAGSEAGQWIDAGHQRETTIFQPEPGSYRFEVTAAVGDGPWLSPVAAVDFTVRPAWWQTAVFRWSVALAVIGAIAMGVRGIVLLRMRARIRQLEQEHAVESERGRIARDMHDELGANLTHIAATTRLATLEPADATADHLREIAAVARQTVDSLDVIVWAVNPHNDTLAGTVEYIGKFAARFLAAAEIEAEIDLPDAIPAWHVSAELRHHLFLAVKEALNNVVKHSGAARARLTIRIVAGTLEVVVADEGRGFTPGAAEHFSNGLVNIRDRMAGIGGRCRIESRPGAGSRVTLELPLSAKFSPPGPA
jgi:signal transduction histidine kinase/ligand-binding sensor domain-containing protein